MADKQQAQAAGQQRQNALMAIAQGTGGDPAKMVPALYQGGFMAEAQALEKHGADMRKSGSESAGRDAETENKVIGAYRDLATNITSPQEAAELVTAMRGDPRLANSPIARVPLDQAIAQIGQDPQALQSWKQQFSLGAEKYITQNKPQYITRDLGGKVQTMAAPGLGGAPAVIASSDKTMTPSERDASARGWAGVNLQRERLAMDKADKAAPQAPAKPLPAAALKMQQEAIDAMGVASSVNADLAALDQQIAGGKLSFGPVSNVTNAARNMAGMSSEESRNFATFKSSLERLRNESLRLNAGVQTEGDAQRAWNELFQNINDTALVQQRLKEIQATNKRAVQLQRMKVDQVRSNYGATPLDESAYTNLPAAVGAGSPPAPVQTATNPKTGEKLQLVNGQWVPMK